MARDLRFFYLFRLLATSYLWMPMFWHFMRSRGLAFDQILLLSAIYSAVVILVEVPTGALADRLGRRRSMMAGALAMVASSLIAYRAHGFLSFAMAEVLAAVSMALCSGADSAYLYDLLASHGRIAEYPRREGVASAWHLAGTTLACAVGGLLGEIDLALPYLVTAVVAGLAFLVALGMRCDRSELGAARSGDRPDARSELRAYLSHMRRSLAEVARSRRLAWIMAYSAVVFVLLRATIYVYQPYLHSRGFGIAQTGFVFAGTYLLATAFAMRAAALRNWLGERTLLWALLGGLSVSFLLLNQFVGPWVLGLLAVQAAARGLDSPLVKPIVNREISHSARRATILSVESLARRLAMGVFSPLAGVAGATSAIYLCGAVGVLGVLLLALLAQHAPLGQAAAARVRDASPPAPGSAPVRGAPTADT